MLVSVNEFIRQQKQLPGFQQAKITIMQFHRRLSFTFVAQPLMECRELTLADYVVGSGTALYDSLMLLIHKFRQCENAIVAVITDGVDTCSRAADQNQVANCIATIQRTMGWHFHYLCVDLEGALFFSGSGTGISHHYEGQARTFGCKRFPQTQLQGCFFTSGDVGKK